MATIASYYSQTFIIESRDKMRMTRCYEVLSILFFPPFFSRSVHYSWSMYLFLHPSIPCSSWSGLGIDCRLWFISDWVYLRCSHHKLVSKSMSKGIKVSRNREYARSVWRSFEEDILSGYKMILLNYTFYSAITWFYEHYYSIHGKASAAIK